MQNVNFVTGTLDTAVTSSASTFDFTISKEMQRGDGTYYDLVDDIATGIIQQIEVTFEDKNSTKKELARVSAVVSNGSASDGRAKYTCTFELNGATKLRGLGNTYDGTNSVSNVISKNIIPTISKNSKVKLAWNTGSSQRLIDSFVTGAEKDTTIIANGAVNAGYVVYVDSSGTATEGVSSGKYYGVSDTTVATGVACSIVLPGNVVGSITVPGTDGDYVYATSAGALTATATGNTLVGIKRGSSQMLVLQPSSTVASTDGEIEAGTDTTPKLQSAAQIKLGVLTHGGTATTIIPTPSSGIGAVSATSYVSDTTAYFRQYDITKTIIANKFSIKTGTVTSAQTMDFSLYSEDGQTVIFSGTTASLSSANTVYETALSAIEIPPGAYYLGVVFNGTVNLQINQSALVGGVLNDDISGKPFLEGQMTVTSGTLPTSFDPSSDLLAASEGRYGPYFRLDN